MLEVYFRLCTMGRRSTQVQTVTPCSLFMICVVTINTIRVIIKHNEGGAPWTGVTDTLDDILEFNAEEGTWTTVGSMVVSRGQHAVSVINYLEIAEYCN